MTMKYPGIGKFCRMLISQGLDNTTILKRAKRKFPFSHVSYHSVAFYRSDMRRNGLMPPDSERHQGIVRRAA